MLDFGGFFGVPSLSFGHEAFHNTYELNRTPLQDLQGFRFRVQGLGSIRV